VPVPVILLTIAFFLISKYCLSKYFSFFSAMCRSSAFVFSSSNSFGFPLTTSIMYFSSRSSNFLLYKQNLWVLLVFRGVVCWSYLFFASRTCCSRTGSCSSVEAIALLKFAGTTLSAAAGCFRDTLRWISVEWKKVDQAFTFCYLTFPLEQLGCWRPVFWLELRSPLFQVERESPFLRRQAR